MAWPWHVDGGEHGGAALGAHRGGGVGMMVVWWRVEAVVRGSSAVLNRYGEEDDRGTVFFSGELGQLQWA